MVTLRTVQRPPMTDLAYCFNQCNSVPIREKPFSSISTALFCFQPHPFFDTHRGNSSKTRWWGNKTTRRQRLTQQIVVYRHYSNSILPVSLPKRVEGLAKKEFILFFFVILVSLCVKRKHKVDCSSQSFFGCPRLLSTLHFTGHTKKSPKKHHVFTWTIDRTKKCRQKASL